MIQNYPDGCFIEPCIFSPRTLFVFLSGLFSVVLQHSNICPIKWCHFWNVYISWNCIEVFECFYRSSRRRCSVKKCFFKNFAIFTGKQLCLSLKAKTPKNRCFLVNFAKFLCTSILKNICKWLILFLVSERLILFPKP